MNARMPKDNLLTQNPMMVALICLCFILAGTILGAWLRRRLPEHHLNKESESVVKLGVGLIATLSALVLGLLISSAKSTYDAKASEVNQITANVIMIDQLLSEYGPEVKPAREKLRSSVQGLVQTMWNEGNEKSANSGSFTPTAAGVETWRLVNSLPTQTEMQRSLSGQIAEAAKSLSQLRLLLFAQRGGSIPAPFLVILVFWLAIIFASLSLFGPMNTTVLAFTFLFAVSAAGAIFLIYELNSPFTGMLQISKTSMLDALGVLPP
jgi:hypothetical protein